MARYRTGVSATVGGVDVLTDCYYDAASVRVAAMEAVYNSPLADSFSHFLYSLYMIRGECQAGINSA